MPNYKDPAGGLHFLDDASFAHLLPAGSVQITDAEAESMRVPTPEQNKARAWEAIEGERDRRKAGGVKVKVGGVNKWFHSDDASRIQQMGLVMMGASIPADLQWKTMDGSFVAMTQALATSVFGAAAASDQVIFGAAEGHRVAMEASADPASYDYSTGWPAVFGE